MLAVVLAVVLADSGRVIAAAEAVETAVGCAFVPGLGSPAGWQDGDKGMEASTEGVAAYLSENADKL